MSRLLYPFYVIAIVVLLIDLWRQPIDREKKILWTIVLLFVPLIGIILFIVLMRSPNSRR